MATVTDGKLKEIREERGMSKSELARRAGTTYQTILNIEQGSNSPRFSVMVKIARALGVSLDELAPDGTEEVRVDIQ
jgi:transcriptional regulator with XRE-family HTH domain